MPEPTYYRSVTLTFPEPVYVKSSVGWNDFRTAKHQLVADAGHAVTIDLHDPVTTPLPVTPGSVVKDEDGDLWVLRDDGAWYCLAHRTVLWVPDDLARHLSDILFTAPAKETSS